MVEVVKSDDAYEILEYQINCHLNDVKTVEQVKEDVTKEITKLIDARTTPGAVYIRSPRLHLPTIVAKVRMEEEEAYREKAFEMAHEYMSGVKNMFGDSHSRRMWFS